MAEAFLALSRIDQAEVLELARARSGRPAHLLEKDVWVVWALAALFDSPLAQHLTFKGGTSLSKAYKLIDRFSEDIDLSCDIRSLIPDLLARDAALPTTRSQANKWTKAVRERLPQWLATDVNPVLEAALAREHLQAGLEIGGADHASVLLHYPATTRGSGYVRPTLTLEFGGRATGEPRQPLQVNCDMDGLVEGVAFPSARPWVMDLARTFGKKPPRPTSTAHRRAYTANVTPAIGTTWPPSLAGQTSVPSSPTGWWPRRWPSTSPAFSPRKTLPATGWTTLPRPRARSGSRRKARPAMPWQRTMQPCWPTASWWATPLHLRS